MILGYSLIYEIYKGTPFCFSVIEDRDNLGMNSVWIKDQMAIDLELKRIKKGDHKIFFAVTAALRATRGSLSVRLF